MLLKFLEALRGEGPILPNSFTIKLGELILEARKEAKLTQAELARLVYLRQNSISNIEKGLRAVSAEELLYMIFALDKPVTYFFPPQVTQELGEDDLTVLEKELLLQARRLGRDDLRRLIAQARALADLGPSPDLYVGKDPIAVVESLFGKVAKEPAKKHAKTTSTKRR